MDRCHSYFLAAKRKVLITQTLLWIVAAPRCKCWSVSLHSAPITRRSSLLLPKDRFPQTIRLCSSSAEPASYPQGLTTTCAVAVTTDATESLYDPQVTFGDCLREIPKALSPSSILEFQKCPQSFLFQYIFKLKQPTNDVLVKGTMVHKALEQVFDLDAPDRTLENLQNLLRAHWHQHRLISPYRELFETSENERDLQAEIEWGKQALKLLENYFELEDPRTAKTPAQREVWVRANLNVQGPPQRNNSNNNNNHGVSEESSKILVRGIVDRLDLVQAYDENNKRHTVLRLVDYKTGQKPDLKYSPSANERIKNETFFQLFIYALLMREMHLESLGDMPVRFLRLLYMKGNQASYMDCDLGASLEERTVKLNQVYATISQVYRDIHQLITHGTVLDWKGCDRSFCYCHQCRPKFVPGTVWVPDHRYNYNSY